MQKQILNGKISMLAVSTEHAFVPNIPFHLHNEDKFVITKT